MGRCVDPLEAPSPRPAPRLLLAHTCGPRVGAVHYARSLMAMLRTERRSNFRDKALQHFGRDAQGREALFEEQR